MQIGRGCLKLSYMRVWQNSIGEMKAFSIIVLCAFATRSSCRPSGAPPEACSQLIPQHPPNVPMAGTGPFSLDVSIPSVGYDPGNGYECMRDNQVILSA